MMIQREPPFYRLQSPEKRDPAAPTTPVVAPSGDDRNSGEVSTTTAPSENETASPADNGGLGEQAAMVGFSSR